MNTFTRRQLLQRTACGFGALALQDIASAAANPLAARIPGMMPKAKRVIFLFMGGGPSQMDLFDPKPFIERKHGQKIDSPLRKEVTQIGTDQFLALKAMAPVRPRGQSGMMISDLMPHLATVADDLCLLRGMNADNPQHAGATLQFHTGTFAEVRPSMGAWVSYGLGTENANLPSFVSIQGGGVREYGSAFLPAIHQGTKLTVPLDSKTLPVENLRNVSENDAIQRQRMDFMARMNKRLVGDLHGDANMEGMIQNMDRSHAAHHACDRGHLERKQSHARPLWCRRQGHQHLWPRLSARSQTQRSWRALRAGQHRRLGSSR
jgi:hypothetical protein